MGVRLSRKKKRWVLRHRANMGVSATLPSLSKEFWRDWYEKRLRRVRGLL